MTTANQPAGAAALTRGLDRFEAWLRRSDQDRLARTLLRVALAPAAALILYVGRDQTFIQDEWRYVVSDRGWSLGVLFHPQNGHLVVAPRLIYRALVAIFGAGTHLPEQLVALGLHLGVALMLFVLARPRIGALLALVPAILILFYGSAS